MTGTAPSLLPCETGCLSWHVAEGPQGCREQELELGSGSSHLWGLCRCTGKQPTKGRCGYHHHKIE